MSVKVPVMSLDGKAGATKQLPKHFSEPVRLDLIKRAVLAIQSRARQPYGADPEAGKKHATYVSRRRRDYRGSYGKGISRVPRKVMSRNGSSFNWEAALAPGTKGGRRAHPPKASKEWTREINVKENRKAIRSAIAATVNTQYVAARGHKMPSTYPFLVADGIEQLAKTKELVAALESLGFTEELARASEKQFTRGRAKTRGRSKQRVSVLIVTSADAPVMLAAENIPGVNAIPVTELNAEILAPGTHPGRMTIFTESALKTLEEKKLFA